MKITGLDGKTYSWIPSNNTSNTDKRSKLHKLAYEVLREAFPYDRIIEEVVLPGSKTKYRNSLLRADFFIPPKGLMVEVHGSQHFKYNSFFFKNKIDFYKAQARDRDKQGWCECNDFRLVEFNEGESVEEWKKKL